MYLDGYKTLSHVKLIEYFSSRYELLDEKQIKLIDTMRKIRNGIVYYGKKVSKEFLINNEEDIKAVISMLIKFVEKRIKI